MEQKEYKICSFCGSPIKEDEGEVCFEGVDGYICKHCAEQLKNILEETSKNDSIIEDKEEKNMLPKEIISYLNDYVIGQDYAKKVIATAIYNHYLRIHQNVTSDVELEKSCILLLGPTGSGKTMIARSIAKMLNVPFAIADATSLTQAGYVGDDVETILTRLLQDCDYDVERAEHGIVFLDEIDKLGRKGGNANITRDVSGEGVQQALLKMIEGTEALVPPNGGRKHPDQKMIKVNTKNILFICAGAFEGIEKIIQSRVSNTAIGFNADRSNNINEKDLLKKVEQDDIRHFGLIPELIGRLPVIAYTEELNEEQLKKVLTEPKNAICKQYVELMKMSGVDLKFTDDAIEEIAKMAIKTKVGARGLRAICEKVMLDAMCELPGGDKKELEINKEYVEKHTL